MNFLNERIDLVLSAMGPTGPRDLRAYLTRPAPDFPEASASEVDQAINDLLSPNANHPARLRFSEVLRSWDNAKDPKWAQATPRNSVERRKVIHQLLKSDAALEQRIEALLPFYRLEEPTIIVDKHPDWYAPQQGVRDYYWRTYLQYLRRVRNWSEPSLLNLENSTRSILECLANPESKEAYRSRGLVMGYVQSGKTANFAGVVARAADVGYRLIIVLAGTWNILRNQTQRRFDKEVLGKEMLRNDAVYMTNPPKDWDEFLEHGTDPVETGHFTWQRLTRPDIDFSSLKASIDSLEYTIQDPAKPLYDPANLHPLPVKFLVIKKHSGILKSLVKDLRQIRTRLSDLPTLFIDDESDQAGVNTIDPAQNPDPGKERSSTNKAIVDLLSLFPRGQYVGYTATPYANALINPDDPEDLFPKDFIVSLDRPIGYMGVSDFFDPYVDFQDLAKEDYRQPEIAFIRRVENKPFVADGEDLMQALRSYLLSGAIKLFRLKADPSRYKPMFFKHHTMLIHTSSSRSQHNDTATRVKKLWERCAFNSPQGLRELKALWEKDYQKVCYAWNEKSADGQEHIVPGIFEELIPSLSDAIKMIETENPILILNSDQTSTAPDFSENPIWKIIVGGNKLSRGYTIEGLTVSFYRRSAATADTLMQMGRWFGFRPGYKDLVRVFLGVREGKRNDIDLVAQFKEVCRMEERFRDELKRYVRRKDAPRITPSQIPPLIALSGALLPTSRNKMFNAEIATKNFGGTSAMSTAAPYEPELQESNIASLKRMIARANTAKNLALGGVSEEGSRVEFSAVVIEAANADVVEFLKKYKWIKQRTSTESLLQIEFLQTKPHGITSWMIIAPQRNESFGDPLQFGPVTLTVKQRQRVVPQGRFKVFGESQHRLVVKYLMDLKELHKGGLTQPNSWTEALRNVHRGVLLLYPVREEKNSLISIGFELFFPKNDLPFDIGFKVRKNEDRVVIPRGDL